MVSYSFKIFPSRGKCDEARESDGFSFVLSPELSLVKQRFVPRYDRRCTGLVTDVKRTDQWPIDGGFDRIGGDRLVKQSDCDRGERSSKDRLPKD